MWERAQLVHEVRGRDIAIEDVPEKTAKVPVELARERRIESQARGRVEIAHQKVPKRLERADRERRHVRQPRRAARADRAAGRGLPRVGLLGESGAALRALTERGAEAGSIEQMQVKPAADGRRIDARVERAQRGLEKVKQRRRWNAVGREAIDELGDIPAGGDEREIVAHIGIDGTRFGAGQDVELTPARELIGGVRQRLRVPGHAARRSPYAFCDDTHFAEMAREEDENPIRLGEVVRLEDDRLSTVRARCHEALMVGRGSRGQGPTTRIIETWWVAVSRHTSPPSTKRSARF